MSKLKIELNRQEVGNLLKSQAVMGVVEGRANAALQELGEGHVVTTRVGKTRCSARISAIWNQTKAANLKSNTLLKAVRRK